jgi:hypothetical protein
MAVINFSFPNANFPHDQACANLCCSRQREHVTVSRGLATEKLHRGGCPTAGGPASVPSTQVGSAHPAGMHRNLRVRPTPLPSVPHHTRFSFRACPLHHSTATTATRISRFPNFPRLSSKFLQPMVPTTPALALAPSRLQRWGRQPCSVSQQPTHFRAGTRWLRHLLLGPRPPLPPVGPPLLPSDPPSPPAQPLLPSTQHCRPSSLRLVPMAFGPYL